MPMSPVKKMPVSYNDIPGSLPGNSIPKGLNPAAMAEALPDLLVNFSSESLMTNAMWRDLLSMTGSIRTLTPAEKIVNAWTELAADQQPSGYRVTRSTVMRPLPDLSWIDVGFNFHTNGPLKGVCAGIASLVVDEAGETKIWMLRTWLERFDGLPGPETINLARHAEKIASASHCNFDVVVIGAGQAGLSVAGRLKAVGVDAVVLERHAAIGDNWTARYDSLKFHLITSFSHLAIGRTFNAEDPEFLGVQRIASGFREWAQRNEINVWCSTVLEKAQWAEDEKTWTLQITRHGKSQTLTCRHLTLATGIANSLPNIPSWPGKEDYTGLLMHSSNYKSAKAWRGKTAVVVGTANTAHDVAQDMLDAGCSRVTMVQRSRTWVFPVDWANKTYRDMYNDMPIEAADRASATMPNKVAREIGRKAVASLSARFPERFDALEKVGFQVERDGDIMEHVTVKFGGHYVDTGTSARIADGSIKVKSGVQVIRYTQHGLAFDDGTELQADVIVLGTGYRHGVQDDLVTLLGVEAASRVDASRGVDLEGEVKGLYRPCGHPNLWICTGEIRQSRFYSRFIALHTQANLLGKPLQQYQG